MSSDELPDDERWLARLGIDSADMITGAGAAAVGAAVAPEAAAAIGFAAPLARRALLEVGREVKDWALGRREQRRWGAVFHVTLLEVRRRLDEGDQVREDGFFETDTERSVAEEILEGSILAAVREHEERKIPYLGYLYASIAFDDTIDRAMANHLVYCARETSWYQLCLLEDLVNHRFGANVFTRESRDQRRLSSAMEESQHAQLAALGLVIPKAEADLEDLTKSLRSDRHRPSLGRRLIPTELARTLVASMQLDRISEDVGRETLGRIWDSGLQSGAWRWTSGLVADDLPHGDAGSHDEEDHAGDE